MKTLFWILLSFFSVLQQLQAQDFQVTLVDPCASIEKKSTIIINDNAAAATNTLKAATENNTVNFTLTTSVNTSAGVYNASGNLIRTLWNGVRYDAGNYKAVWSGIMDDGTLAPPGTYQVKVLTNNVQYIWEGVIGNTSVSLTDNVFKSYGGNTCFAFVGTKGFYGQFFYEGGTNSKYFNTGDIGKSYDANFGVHAVTIDCATDSVNVYWIGLDQYQNNGVDANQSNYIYACKASDNSAVAFANEAGHNSGRENEYYPHFIGWYTDLKNAGLEYNGIAVNNNFIFVTLPKRNQLFVFNKTSGATVQTLTYTNPTKLAAGSADELWMVVNKVLKKFTVNGTTGALTDANLSIAATSPSSVKISPDNSTVLVADVGTQQVKAYANSTGNLLWSLGQPGGYDLNGPAVANDKFMFDRVDFASPAIAYQPDGSFWVNDIGNYRTLHFNADRSYKEQIAFMPASRSSNVDPNKPTSVFGDELEFQRDYSKPLDNGANGSWKLVNNWKVGTSLDIFAKFLFTITLSNGHTYAGSGSRVYDLTPTGAVDVCAYPVNGHMEADGSFWTRLNYGNNYFEVRKQPLTGFTTLPSGAQVPSWGAAQVVVTTPTITAMMPLWYVDNTIGAASNPNRYFFFNPNSASLGFGTTDFNYHLGAIKTGGNTFEWQGSKGTFYDYHGDYPRNGDYDLGNNDFGNQHSENCKALVNGSNVFWNVNGEFWKANSPGGGEINIWNHFNEDGLLIGNFGKTGLDTYLTGNTGFAGNAFSTALVKVNGSFYIYHCDENQHGGVHSWHITGLNTIAEQTLPITVSASVVPINDTTNLMTGLPYRSTSFTGGDGFSVQTPAGLVLKTNTLQYQKGLIDIALGGDGDVLINKSLNNTARLSNWKLTAGISYQNGELSFGTAPDGSNNYNYLEILDVSGKIIARFIGNQADTRNNYYRRVWFNSTIVAEGSGFNGFSDYYFRDISFSYANGTLTFKHQDYPAVSITKPFQQGADMTSPSILHVNQGGNRTRYINLSKLNFSKK
ncbi:MAG: FlgD immunoglobulin-like domain containing protein [Mucilaginibacter sp.]|uniref:FlgD immunoglobulin-like domain containing protein n=1 Tax=Mucilaginibacter sp. TaxID=1882438 RepID=UPI0034E57CCD